MKNRCLAIIVVAVMALLSACASSMSDREISNIKKIGILNQFPDKPTFSRLTLTNSEVSDTDLPQIKPYLTNKFIAELNKLGFEAQEVSGRSALENGQVDMLLELVPLVKEPRDYSGYRYDASDEELDDGTHGFGIYYKSLLLIQVKPIAYVSMQVDQWIKEDSSIAAAGSQTKKAISKIDIKELPKGWRRMDDGERNEAEKALKDSIDEAVEEVIADMGF